MALLLMLMAIFLLASYQFYRQANRVATAGERQARTAEALARAKEALIARAVLDEERPGSLPCPDILYNDPGNNVPGDGKADLLNGSECFANVGWLPWVTLDLPELVDESGTRFWYALSRTLRDDDSAEPINSDTATTLTLDGNADIAAIIFAPGAAHGAQNRPSNTVADYLDGANGDGDDLYVSGPTSDTFNDRVLIITRGELMRAVEKRVAKEALNLLDAYRDANGVFPYPAEPGCIGGGCVSDKGVCRGRFPETVILGPPHNLPNWGMPLPGVPLPPWFHNNHWANTLYYAVGTSRLKLPHTGGFYASCSPQIQIDSSTADMVLITPGTPNMGIPRPTAALPDYLEDAANQDGWTAAPPAADAYVTPSPPSNDHLYFR